MVTTLTFSLIGKELLERRDQIVEQISSKEVLVRQLRIGVTELTALTWLPRLISAIQAEYPKVTVEPEVDLNATLRDRLAADTIDIIVVPQVRDNESFATTKVGEVDNAWMCAPALGLEKTAISLADIPRFPLILQGSLPGTGFIYARFLQEHGVSMQRVLASNSLIAQIGLTLSGLGVSYLPMSCHAQRTRHHSDTTCATARLVRCVAQGRPAALARCRHRSTCRAVLRCQLQPARFGPTMRGNPAALRIAATLAQKPMQ